MECPEKMEGVVAILTAEQKKDAEALLNKKQLAEASLDSMMAALQKLHTINTAEIAELSNKFWQGVYASFGLDPEASYALDMSRGVVVEQKRSEGPSEPSPPLEDNDALSSTEGDFLD